MYPLKDSAVVYRRHGLLCLGCRVEQVEENKGNRVCWCTALQLGEVSHETHHEPAHRITIYIYRGNTAR